MGREVVIWSGGIDSTTLLHEIARNSSLVNPVYAYTIKSHPQMDSKQFSKQWEAQENYLRFARGLGFHIYHEYMEVSGNIVLRRSEGRSLLGDQAIFWLCNLSPYILDGDRVHFGYIVNDCFWHGSSEFRQAFLHIMNLKCVSAELLFDYEWYTKKLLVERFQSFDIPENCWWTCESPIGEDPCNECHKCLEVNKAFEEIVVDKKDE